MLTMLLTALAGVGAVSLLTLAAKGALALGAGKKAGDAIQALPDAEVVAASSSSDVVHGAAVIGHYLEVAAKKELTGEKLTAFIAFLGTAPTSTAVLAYAEQNLGSGFVNDIVADIPEAAADELAIFGPHLPTVVRTFLGKLLPGIAHAQAQQVLSSQEIAAKLTALTTAAPAPLPKVA